MATREQLRSMSTAQPFRPFVIKMNSGRSFTIRHPENAACDSLSRSLVVFDDEGLHHVEMFLVEVIEPVAEPAQPAQPCRRATGPDQVEQLGGKAERGHCYLSAKSTVARQLRSRGLRRSPGRHVGY